ncbi:MAG TPA: DUF1839 family protein [Vicinamibacterales bacterium]|jgi:hypothetical protein
MTSVAVRDAAAYAPHELHSPDRIFAETNCYTDIWIELLHGRGEEPLAMLAYCIAVDFEGDQWTFFKPPPADLERLYGAEIGELLVYRSLVDHVAEQLALGRTPIVEVDAHHLPDTAGRTYREGHEKTSIAVDWIDVERRRLGYFHGLGFFVLEGEDFAGSLRLDVDPAVDSLPPYVEFVRWDRLEPRRTAELPFVARALLDTQLARLPRTNPVARFGERLELDLGALLEGDLAEYHRYAFATLRQCGAAWELASSFLAWLAAYHRALRPSADAYGQLAEQSKALLFRLARAPGTGRRPDVTERMETLAASWDEAVRLLRAAG